VTSYFFDATAFLTEESHCHVYPLLVDRSPRSSADPIFKNTLHFSRKTPDRRPGKMYILNLNLEDGRLLPATIIIKSLALKDSHAGFNASEVFL